MGRKKIIEDDALLDLIKTYYNEVCHGNARLLKLPHIAEYIRKNGYDDYQVTTLRRNEAARTYIESLKGNVVHAGETIVYKTLDVESFLNNHTSRDSMKKALTDLDTSYRNMAEAAMTIKDNNRKLEKEADTLSSENASLKEENDRLSKNDAIQKAKIKELSEQNDTFKRFIDDNVYPEIANQLLKDDWELKGFESKTIDPDYVEADVIRADSQVSAAYEGEDAEISAGTDTDKDGSNDGDNVENNVIKGLFDDFNE